VHLCCQRRGAGRSANTIHYASGVRQPPSGSFLIQALSAA
jgi:hypothetical protein